ncbi:MAG TPA: Mth938-like domain-containing protein [Steroidobacteraceae bacterium]
MKFTLDRPVGVNVVRAYSHQEIRIGEHIIHGSCIVMADALITDWEPATSADLAVPHLDRIFELKPELVVLGTGPLQRFPRSDVRAAFTSRQIGLETMDLGAACRTYNVLVSEGRRAAAALFLE